jgi:ABC-2 type transport system permease protein
MGRMWLVARREYSYNLRRRSFLFGAFVVPVMVGVIMVIAFSALAESESNAESIGQVGYIDRSGVLTDAVETPQQFVVYDSEDAARQALDDQTIGAYFVLPEDYLETGVVQLYTNTSTPEALDHQIGGFLVANLSARLNSGLPAERILEPVDITYHIQDSGRTLTNEQIGGLFFTPIIFVTVFAMASQITSGFLMSGVVEEKTNRVMEILITSVTPMQLLAGKILGLGLLGLTQLAVWLLGGFALLRLGNNVPLLSGVSVPPDIIVISAIYFVLAYFLMGSIMAGIGAVVGSEQESRQIAGIFSIVLFIPMFFIISFITDPEGVVPLVLTLIPFTAPMSVLLRLSFATIPAWQLILSIVILALTTVFVVWASARIFRWALLLYGKRPGLRELWRAVRRSPRIETSGEAA